MKKYLLFLILLILGGCAQFSSIEERCSCDQEVVYLRLKDMLIKDGFRISEDKPESGLLISDWKKMDRSENNIPDNTIQGKVEFNLVKEKEILIIKAKIRKRSSLASSTSDEKEIQYDEVNVLYNDLLFRKWDDIIVSIKNDLDPPKPGK